jgi:hypothetical protein
MSERSEQRRGEEEWRAGTEPQNRPARSRAWLAWLLIIIAAAVVAAWFYLRR